MPAETIGGRAVDGWLTLARVPWQVGARLVPVPGWRDVIDRTDANLRLYAGRLLRDDALIEDAERRQAAAVERERADQLKVAAEREKLEAERRADEKLAQAQRLREEAETRAAQQAAKVEADKRAKEQRVTETARRREDSVEQIADVTDRALDARAREARLEVLERESEALAKEEEALTADKEQARLAEAAGRVKAARKSGG